MIQPILLEAEYHPFSSCFFVRVTIQGDVCEEVMEFSDYRDFCKGLDLGIYMDELTFTFSRHSKRDITIRLRRGVAQYFRSILQKHTPPCMLAK